MPVSRTSPYLRFRASSSQPYVVQDRETKELSIIFYVIMYLLDDVSISDYVDLVTNIRIIIGRWNVNEVQGEGCGLIKSIIVEFACRK